ncbi:MAG: phosphate signaling complex protein PhoU [Pirellulales bacterium]|jgi:phosphate transport system protein|nr:phosphate signaling complex protein PhoU [Pirellulales bacterium]MBL7193993.1 phosphate signaling complex protein PhoU [Pirellulales bacterium]MDA0816772.1 phosphate signaling complex protein PhoU [Planctomycetota bacterium]MDA0970460.1 phosphate signaling complex protein PhoU [Planctomycetota bacterium]
MTRHIERQIDQLKQKILFVGTLVEEAISKAITALINRDIALAQRVMTSDAEIDRMEVEVEEECLKILALYQPVAADLRFVVSALKINNDLERMGDLAKNIAKRVGQLARGQQIDLPPEIRTMAMQAQEMVKESLDAVVNGDTALARHVREQDDAVDEGRQRIRERVLRGITETPEIAESLMRINSVSKHIERLADMATNIAEDVIYMVEGEIVRHRASD